MDAPSSVYGSKFRKLSHMNDVNHDDYDSPWKEELLDRADEHAWLARLDAALDDCRRRAASPGSG